jgi:hypothetical protein
MTRRSLLGGLTAAALLAGAGVAPAQTAESYDIALSPAKANRSAGFTLSGTFDGQKVIDQVRFKLPAGSRFDTSAAPRCTKTPQQIESEGGPEKACSDDSVIGEGEATAVVGGTPLKIPLRVWNRRNAMIIQFQIGTTGFFSIAPIEGRTISVPLDRAPALDAKATAFSLEIERQPAGEDPYLRTPRVCPGSRKWRSQLEYRTFQGGTTTLRDTVSCKKR